MTKTAKLKFARAYNKKYSNKTNKLTTEDIVDHINFLSTQFPVVDIENDKLICITNPITINKINLGQYKLTLTPNSIDVNKFPESKTKNKYIHPHAIRKHICLGNGTMPFRRARRVKNITEMFIIVAAVLNNYSSNNSYCEIETCLLNDPTRCDYCGDIKENSDMVKVKCCNAFVCKKCTRTCSKCKNPICKTFCKCSCKGK